MKQLRSFITICLILMPALCLAVDAEYGYPLPGPYGATIIGTPSALKAELPKEINSKRVVLDVIPGVTKSDIFYYDEGLQWFLTYTTFLVIIHHLFLFFIEAFTFQGVLITLIRVVLSSVLSVILIVMSQFIIFRK